MNITRKATIIVAAFLFTMIFLSISVCASLPEDNGIYKKKLNGTTWYFVINDYTDRTSSTKYLGEVHIYKGRKNFDNYKKCFSGQYYKSGSHKYTVKTGDVKITFTIKSNYIQVKQKKGKIKGTKMNGKFSLVRHRYA